METEPIINQYLRQMLELGGSDLHLSIDCPPKARVHGDIIALSDEIITPEYMEEMLKEICMPRRWEKFMETHDLDFAHEIPGLARFRTNYLYNYHGMGCVMRQIPTRILTLEELHMPEVLKEICALKSGLVLVTGPTGSGKSTTLAAMIDYINENFSKHIITIEDPIEYFHDHQRSVVTQREIGRDVPSFAEAIRGALRQDPDIILVGEMRDLETITAAVSAAETGHLVFATLHTTGAARTVDRIVDAFPADTKDQIRTQLASSLVAVISQVLCRRRDGGRIAAYEIMINPDSTSALIRDNKTYRITSDIQTGGNLGMRTLDSHLLTLAQEGYIESSEAVKFAQAPNEMRDKLRQLSLL